MAFSKKSSEAIPHGKGANQMSEQPDLFDLAEGKRLRDLALSRHEDRNPKWLDLARTVAFGIAKENGTVNANEVRAILEPAGIVPHHPNAWGSLFRGKMWERTGERVPSKIKASHASEIGVWRLSD
jgi:hypothetical protein